MLRFLLRASISISAMPKRPRSLTGAPAISEKRARSQSASAFAPYKIASAEAAAAVDANLPLTKLINAVKEGAKNPVANGECVVYWMRMGDLRGKAIQRVQYYDLFYYSL